jgi:hypothetical protein
MFSVMFGVCEIDNFVEGSNLHYDKAPFCLFTCLFFFLLFILYMPWKHRRRCSLIILHT